MAMDGFASYRIPGETDLPSPAVPWLPRSERAVVLVHDMQRYFLRPFPEGESPLAELLANTAKLIATARAAGVPVMYTAQPGDMTRHERGLLHDFWGPGMSRRESDRAIADEVAPRAGETVLTKWRYSAFHRSDLEERLLRAGRDQLIVCGVFAHVGCLMTACDAFTRDIQPFLVADAMADFSLEHHAMALRYAAARCAVPLSTARALKELEVQPAVSITSAAE
ncbi:isochorismatase family protein [Nonomuraea sp. NPDC059023]|uniref:isochorismatase family protein n=1 Tax=unclassified Nonomuraea TaxID=2593643 RepID=UPI0036B2D767